MAWDPKKGLGYVRNKITLHPAKVMQVGNTPPQHVQKSTCIFRKFFVSVFHFEDLCPVPQIPAIVLLLPDLIITAHLVKAHLERHSAHKSATPAAEEPCIIILDTLVIHFTNTL